jgi:hypothetical protein
MSNFQETSEYEPDFKKLLSFSLSFNACSNSRFRGKHTQKNNLRANNYSEEVEFSSLKEFA